MTRRSSVGDICPKLRVYRTYVSDRYTQLCRLTQKHFLHGQCAAGSLQVRIKKLLNLI